MDWSFYLLVLQVQGFLTHYRTLAELVPKKPWQDQKPQRASAAMMQWLLSKLEREFPHGADPEGTSQGWCSSGSPSPAAPRVWLQGQLMLQQQGLGLSKDSPAPCPDRAQPLLEIKCVLCPSGKGPLMFPTPRLSRGAPHPPQTLGEDGWSPC